METALEALPLTERGLVLGLALTGAAPDAAERVRGVDCARCRRALEALAAASPDARRGALGALARAVREPVPPRIERVHPGWIRRALEGEPADVVRAVVAGLPPEVGRVADELCGSAEEGAGVAPAPRWRAEAVDELRRILFGGLAPMEGSGLVDLPLAGLLDELDRRGAVVLGRSVAGAPPEVVARAAAGLGEALGRAVIEAARAEAPSATRDEARALVAAARTEQELLGAARAVGLRAVARELLPEGWDAVRAVAHRLPPVVGEILLAIASAEEAATWGGS